MRKTSVFLLVMVLVITACSPDEQGSSTTSAPQASGGSLDCGFVDAYMSPAGVPFPACANIQTVKPTDGLETFPFDVNNALADGEGGHFCLIFPDQVFVMKADDFAPSEFGLDPLLDGGAIDPENPGTVQDALEFFASEASDAGLYRFDGGSDVFDMIQAINSAGFLASPHYQLAPSPTWKYGPDNTPTPVGGSWDDLAVTGENVEVPERVIVIDTGTTAIGATDDIGITQPPGEEEVLPPSTVVPSPSVAGHGTFAASIARQFNHALEVDSYRASQTDGVLSEASAVAAIMRANPGEGDVVNLSLGTYPCAPQFPGLGLLAQMKARPGTWFVAASGNDSRAGQHQPMFPASVGFDSYAVEFVNLIERQAASGMIVDLKEDLGVLSTQLEDLAKQITAVGALEEGQTAADFSNPGEVMAPGVDVVGWLDGGLAVWSGTSFAAPHFAACLASGLCAAP